jgi:hypothetical protein
MVLYSTITPYDLFFGINCHIARQDFILNDQLSGVRNPGKIKYLLANVVRLNDVTQAQTRSKNLQPLCQNDI